MPVGIAHKGKDQFEIAQVAVIIEEAVRTIIGESRTCSRINRGQDGRGEFELCPHINSNDGGYILPETMSSVT